MNISQIITVTNVKENKGKFRLYEECDKNLRCLVETYCFIGKNGITRNKKESDGKTPQGIYSLGIAFGMHEKINTNLEYIKINENMYWIDDSNSKHYNKLVDVSNTEKDWKTAEHLIDYPKQYEYAIEIKYNEEQIKGKGSAIFIHCEVGKQTAGCIAIPKEKMIQVLQFVKENAIIII